MYSLLTHHEQVQSLLRASGRRDVDVEIVFPVNANAITTAQQQTSASSSPASASTSSDSSSSSTDGSSTVVGGGCFVCRVGQNRIYTPFMAICMVVICLKYHKYTPYIRIYVRFCPTLLFIYHQPHVSPTSNNC